MKVHRGSGGTASLTFNLGTNVDQPHALSGLPSGKKPQELTEERAGWASQPVSPVRKRDKSLGSVVIRTPELPARGLATTLTSSRFPYTNPRMQ